MSSEFPARPSLEYLKKQAKDRLATMRAASPSARLADAQHAIAREYGFVSWAGLKTHLELLAADFQVEGYNTEARRVLYFPRDEAAKRGSTTIEPEHIVLGLVREGHVTLERARAHMPL